MIHIALQHSADNADRKWAVRIRLAGRDLESKGVRISLAASCRLFATEGWWGLAAGKDRQFYASRRFYGLLCRQMRV